MSNFQAQSALKQYGRVGVSSGVEGASAHRLIQMLMAGALARIARAAGQMRRRETAAKGESIGFAISIIDALRASLDHHTGGDMARNLESLYEYMGRRLLEANLRNDVAILDEVHGLLNDLKATWDELPGRLNPQPSADHATQALRAS